MPKLPLAHTAVTLALTLAASAPLSAQVASSDSLAVLRVRVVHDITIPVPGALVRSGHASARTDVNGAAMLRLTPGAHVIVAMRLGYTPDSARVSLIARQDTSIVLVLEERAAEVERVVIASTRAERRMEDSPLRVEVIDEEEVAEKVAMTPGDIAMMLNETAGLRVQTTSPSLGGANVRIQGLRGRYTLMLADGLPLYGGQAGGIGLLQIPPVDLARAEIIKGTASALYGSSALGGVVNLVSRRPGAEPVREVLLNQTSRGGTDAVAFVATALGQDDENASAGWGATLLASGHHQRANDPDDDGWADLPGYDRLVVRPRLFHSRGRRSAFATIGFTGESREGGTLDGRTTPDGSAFVESLRTRRLDAGASGRTVTENGVILSARTAGVEQRHAHRFGSITEDDRHRTWFVEASAAVPRGNWTYVAGAAWQTEWYRNRDAPAFDYISHVPSVFAQADVDPVPWLALSLSARVDRHNEYGASMSPRLSALFRMPDAFGISGWTLRMSGGGGTFAPVPFTEETDVTGLSAILPLANLELERAISGSVDLSVPFELAAASVELNATLHGSRLTHAVAAREVSGTTAPSGVPFLELVNAPAPARTWGGELLARVLHGPLRVTATWAYLRATEWDPDAPADPFARRAVPLTPRYSAGLVASVEQEETYRLGLEFYYTGRQSLDDNPYRDRSRPYVIVGMLGERWITTGVGSARVFLNLENIGNVRQTREDPLLLPARGRGGRWTTDAWTDLGGFTVNGGVRLTFP
ncbi:MAG TPA: TonB-dependent receptor plug domain-containing protein [Gemmatimonadaceae bacterium]|nr:TonB-dependent receptor plug domain-containing protein [Gemmatimonadaceae bacterium]